MWSEMETSYISSLFHFKWAPVSRQLNFDLLSGHGHKAIVNHFENHHLLSQKDQLYAHMLRFSEQNKLNVFQSLPIQFVIDFSQKSFGFELEKFT